VIRRAANATRLRDAIKGLDARSKLTALVAVATVALLWQSPLLLGALAAVTAIAALVSGVDRGTARLIAISLVPIACVLLLSHGFFYVGRARDAADQNGLDVLLRLPGGWWLIGGATLTREGLLYGTAITFKALTLSLAFPLFILTTDLDTMIVSLVHVGVPYRLAFVFSSGLRFLPLILQEAQAVSEAQRLRGLPLEHMGMFRRGRAYARMVVPLFLGTMVRSQQLEMVLLSRAFPGTRDRTFLHDSGLGLADYAVMAVSVLGTLLGLSAFFLWGVGRTGS
jgi:energy-coupling factor transport system permease protein